MNERKSQFTFLLIISCRLSNTIIMMIIENIITNLKTHADAFTKSLPIANKTFIRYSRHCTRLRTSSNESSSLISGNVIINLLRDGLIIHIIQLKKVAIRKVLSSNRHNLYQTRITWSGSTKKRSCKDIITHQNCHLIAIRMIDRALSPTLITFINNIIMNKTCSMEKLEGCRCINCILIHLSCNQLCRQKRKHRTHHLALPTTNSRKNIVEQRVRVHKIGIKHLPVPIHLCSNRVANLL